MAKSRAKPANNRKSTPKRTKTGKYAKGSSGNPKGRPAGVANLMSRKLRSMLEAEAEAVTAALINAAKAGDGAALKLVVDRISPAPKFPFREPFEVGKLETVDDCAGAMRRLTEAVATGELVEDHADSIAARIRDTARLVEVADLESRIVALEETMQEQAQ